MHPAVLTEEGGREGSMLLRRFPGASSTLLAFLAATVLSFHLRSHLVLTNDDARFPMLARDILTHGHWLLPALPNGEPHLFKPPLLAWLIALISWPFGGVTVLTAVLPSVLSAIGVVLLTCRLGRETFSAVAGVTAALMLVTMAGVFSLAQSALPDMVQLVGIMCALAAYVTFDRTGARAWLVAFYGLVGVASLSKGVPGLLPLLIVGLDTLITRGAGAVRRLVSAWGIALLLIVAVPWWIVAGRTGGHEFVSHVAVEDQILWYFHRPHWDWAVVTEPFRAVFAITLPWGLALPASLLRLRREADPGARRWLCFLVIWLSTVFVVTAISGQQRERYYLPVSAPAALLVARWYTTLHLRRQAAVFTVAWLAVIAVGAVVATAGTRRMSSATDLTELQALLARTPALLYSMKMPELALAFTLKRPVIIVNTYDAFTAAAAGGDGGYLIVADQMLTLGTPRDLCLVPVARGTATKPFTVLAQGACAGDRTRGL